MSLQLISPPAVEPVSLAEAKVHLKIDTPDEDVLIATLITAARARAEWHTGRAFVTQNWIQRFDTWLQEGELALSPLQAVSEIAFFASDGARTVLAPSDYRIDKASEPARFFLSTSPPRLRAKDCLEIAFTAGYGAPAAVPAAVREAILQIVTDLYSHRGEEIVGFSGQALLAPYRIFRL